MKNIIPIIVLILMANLAFAQTEKKTYKAVAEKFERYYNEGAYQAIFSMFSNEMQQALPANKTTDFFTGLKSQVGNIIKREFIEYKNKTVASYKTTFERAIFVLNISIDNDSKINGLLVKPFIENDPSEFAYNNLPVQDSIITKKQSDLIFEKSKVFPNRTQISIAIIENGNIKFLSYTLSICFI